MINGGLIKLITLRFHNLFFKKNIGLFLIFIGGLLFIMKYGTLLQAVITYNKSVDE